MNTDLREEIAEEAARIILEQGETNYYLAKQKAARRKAAVDQSDLPSNQEVEAHVKRRLSLFDPKDHKQLIQKKRQEALSAMRFLQEFEPVLTGPVLDGTASKFSPIEIHLFVDAVEQVTIFLMEHDIPYKMLDRKLRMGKNEDIVVPVLSFFADDQAMELTVFPYKFKHHSPLSAIDGAPQKRMNLKKLDKLLKSDQTTV